MYKKSPVSNMLMSSHVARAHHQRRLASAALTALLCACGGGGGSGDGAGGDGGAGDTDGAFAIPGYVIDCTPEIAGDPMVCVSKDDWECSQSDYYVRESICARLFSGTPSEFDGKPQMSTIDLDGAGPQMPVGELDCANLPDEVVSGYESLSSCNECRVCGNQLWGQVSVRPYTKYGWDELAFCPDNYDDLNAGLCMEDNDEQTPTTGEGDDSGGDTDAEALWKCMGSWTIMGTMVDTDLQLKDEIYMSGPAPDCVNATNAEGALASCIELCEFKDLSYATEAANSDSKNWESFPCVDLGNFTPLVAADANECAGGGPMWMTVPLPFAATAHLSTAGATAQTDQLSGLLDFALGECSAGGTHCEVSLSKLRVGPRTVHGMYRDGNAATAPFALTHLELDLLQPVSGQMDPRTGQVRFPGRFFAAISAAQASLDGKPLSEGIDRAVFIVEGAEGTWNGHQLFLNLRWAGVAGMSASLRLTAG